MKNQREGWSLEATCGGCHPSPIVPQNGLRNNQEALMRQKDLYHLYKLAQAWRETVVIDRDTIYHSLERNKVRKENQAAVALAKYLDSLDATKMGTSDDEPAGDWREILEGQDHD